MPNPSDLTDSERQVLGNIVAGGTVRAILEKFAAYRYAEMTVACSSAMASVPRQTEAAADYAAKAEVYKILLQDLERFSNQ
jgi:hypothetical protein